MLPKKIVKISKFFFFIYVEKKNNKKISVDPTHCSMDIA